MVLKVVTILLWILRFGYNLCALKSGKDAYNSLPSFHFRVMVSFCPLKCVAPPQVKNNPFHVQRKMSVASRRNCRNSMEPWKRRFYCRCRSSWSRGEILFYLLYSNTNSIYLYNNLFPRYQVGYSASQAALFVR